MSYSTDTYAGTGAYFINKSVFSCLAILKVPIDQDCVFLEKLSKLSF